MIPGQVQIFLTLVGSIFDARVGSATSGSGKFPLKMSSSSIFSLGVKKISLVWSKILRPMTGRTLIYCGSGQGPSLQNQHLLSDGSGSKIFDPGWVNFLWLGSGRVSHLWFGFNLKNLP